MLLAVTSTFLIGLTFGSYLVFVPRTIFLLLILTAVVLTLLERRTYLTATQGLVLYGTMLAGTLLWASSDLTTQNPGLPALAGPAPIPVEATIVEPVRHRSHRSVMVVSVTQLGTGSRATPVAGKARLTWRNPNRDFSQGDVISFTGRLRTPSGTLNPGGFDYAAYLKRRDIEAVASVSGPDQVKLRSSGRTRLRWLVWHVIDSWRERIRQAATNTLNGDALGIYLGIIIGEQGFFGPELRDRFMSTGTVHIISISGSHLGLIAFLSFFFFRTTCRHLPDAWLLSLSRRITPTRLAALLTVLPVTFYTLLAGSEVATVRALVMIVVFLLAVWLGHGNNLLHALGVAALLIVCHDPQALFDISFQLSFVSVLAIALILRWRGNSDASYLEAPDSIGPRAGRWLRDYAWITAAVTLVTLPLVAYYFNQIAWLGLLANLIVVPLAGLVLVPLGLTSAVVLLLLGGDTLPFGQLNQFLLDLASGIVGRFAEVPGAEWHVASPLIPVMLSFYALLLLGCWPRMRRTLRWGALLCATCIVAWWIWSPRTGTDGETLRVTFLDVGQGDACVIELPEGEVVLIDAGAAYEVLDMGRAVVGPYLWDHGIRHLDLVIGTHPQLDHVGGLPWVFRHFTVGEYVSNGFTRNQVFYDRLRNSIQAQGLVEGQAVADQVLLSSKSCQLIALNPPPSASPSQGSAHPTMTGGSLLNNLSVVTRLDCGPHSFLLTADIESEAMTRLHASGSSLSARVIKVPHHGSRSSLNTGWIRHIGAEAAVISVGRHNPYRHPAKPVLQAYAEAGTRLWRTDQEGAVSVIAKLSSSAMSVKTARGALPRPLEVESSTWRSEGENLSLIWGQWMGS